MGRKGWAPAVDLCETAEAFVFTAELPGLSREQVRIDVARQPPDAAGPTRGAPVVRAVSPGRTRPRRVPAHLRAAARGRRRRGDRRSDRRRADHHRPEAPGGRATTRGRFLTDVEKSVHGLPAARRRHRRRRAIGARDRPAGDHRARAARCRPTVEPAEQVAAVPVNSGGPDFTRVAAQSVRAVTNISSVQVVRRSASPFANDPFFQYFFGDQGDDVRPQPRANKAWARASSSRRTAWSSPTTTCSATMWPR